MRRKRGFRRGLLLTPLIDVMFLLTLFFVINTSFQQERYIEVSLPESTSSQGGEGAAIVVTLLPNAVIKLNGGEVGLDSLTEEIRLSMEEGSGNEVVVQGDESIPYELAIAVLDKIRMAGLNAVSLQTLGAER